MGSLTTQERKEPDQPVAGGEEPMAGGEEPGYYFGEIPCLGSQGQMFSCLGVQVGLVSILQNLSISHLPLSVALHQ